MFCFSHVYQQLLFNTTGTLCSRKHLKSLEGMTQRDPTPMAIYALGMTPPLV